MEIVFTVMIFLFLRDVQRATPGGRASVRPGEASRG